MLHVNSFPDSIISPLFGEDKQPSVVAKGKLPSVPGSSDFFRDLLSGVADKVKLHKKEVELRNIKEVEPRRKAEEFKKQELETLVDGLLGVVKFEEGEQQLTNESKQALDTVIKKLDDGITFFKPHYTTPVATDLASLFIDRFAKAESKEEKLKVLALTNHVKGLFPFLSLANRTLWAGNNHKIVSSFVNKLAPQELLDNVYSVMAKSNNYLRAHDKLGPIFSRVNAYSKFDEFASIAVRDINSSNISDYKKLLLIEGFRRIDDARFDKSRKLVVESLNLNNEYQAPADQVRTEYLKTIDPAEKDRGYLQEAWAMGPNSLPDFNRFLESRFDDSYDWKQFFVDISLRPELDTRPESSGLARYSALKGLVEKYPNEYPDLMMREIYPQVDRKTRKSIFEFMLKTKQGTESLVSIIGQELNDSAKSSTLEELVDSTQRSSDIDSVVLKLMTQHANLVLKLKVDQVEKVAHSADLMKLLTAVVHENVSWRSLPELNEANLPRFKENALALLTKVRNTNGLKEQIASIMVTDAKPDNIVERFKKNIASFAKDHFNISV